MCAPSRRHPRRASPPRGRQPGGRESPEHTAGDAADARAGHIVQAVGLVAENRGCRAQSAADGGAYALAEVTRGEARGVPRDESVVAPHDLDVAAQVVAETARIVLRTRGEPLPEGGDEVGPVSADILTPCLQTIGDGAHPDVQPAALLRHVPGIARQPLLEEPQVTVAIRPVVGDLVLEGDDLQRTLARIELAEELAVYRAARAAGTDQVAATERIVDEVALGVRLDVTDVVLHDFGTGALEQPRIELEAADRVLHAGHRQVPSSHVHPQPRKSEEAMRVAAEVHGKIAHHFRCDPAGTELQPREALAIEHQHIRARAAQLPRGGGARRAATDDEHVTPAHELLQRA